MVTLIRLRFVGTGYCGWQVQKNGVSVQQTVQDALEKLFGERLPLTGCSRTDSGVHANEYFAHITGLEERYVKVLPAALNSVLPRDICVTGAERKPDGFHARYSAKGKEYIYLILDSPLRDPFLEGRVMHVPRRLDERVLNGYCSQLVGRHDFSAYSAAGCGARDTVRTVSSFTCERRDGLIRFSVTADGFLYNMVRIMTGTVLRAAEGSLKLSIPEITASRRREYAGHTVPACGLYLNRVFYD